MYENGILFAQNLELARDYYTRAGVYKTDLAEERVRVTNEERVAAAIAKAEAPSIVKVDKFGNSSIKVSETPSAPQAAAPTVSPTPQAVSPVPPQPVHVPAQAAVPSAPGSDFAAMAAQKAQEAAQAASLAAQKAQEAAQAAQAAAEYAQKACR
jgi:hypothetical protein